MNDSVETSDKRALFDRLRRLKHLRKTRMLSLDDGGFVRDVVAQMDDEIRRIEKALKTPVLHLKATEGYGVASRLSELLRPYLTTFVVIV